MANEFSKIPEGCIANVISLTTPRDACRYSAVSTLFHTASDSDTVWERLLPPDYQDIIAKSDINTQMQLLSIHSKKQLFMRLADSPILVDVGRKSFFLDKSSGKKCFMINARDTFIVWGDTPMYWIWASLPDSRFAEVAILRAVCWLEISLRIEASLLSPKTTYVAYLVFKYRGGRNVTFLEHIPVDSSVGMADGVKNTKTIYLAPEDGVDREPRIAPELYVLNFFNAEAEVEAVPAANRVTNGQYPKRRADGWLEAELGEVFVEGGDSGDFVEVSVMEVKDLNWKNGLVIEGIEFRPKT